MEKIVDVKFFGNFKKKSQKWPTQDLSSIERNKVMKNQPLRGIPRGLAYYNPPGGGRCRIGLKFKFVKNGQKRADIFHG